jgi:hypothetical protein
LIDCAPAKIAITPTWGLIGDHPGGVEAQPDHAYLERCSIVVGLERRLSSINAQASLLHSLPFLLSAAVVISFLLLSAATSTPTISLAMDDSRKVRSDAVQGADCGRKPPDKRIEALPPPKFYRPPQPGRAGCNGSKPGGSGKPPPKGPQPRPNESRR